MPFSDHPVTTEEAKALDNVPLAQRAGRSDFGTIVAQAGRVLDVELEFGACADQKPEVERVVATGADRLVVTVRRSPSSPPRTPPSQPTPPLAEAECGGVGMSRGLSVTLPSDKTFTGTIEVRDAR